MNRIEIEIHNAIPLIEEIVKPIALAKEAGRDSSWYIKRKNGNQNNGTVYVFRQVDIDLINESLQRIGSRLLETRITYGSDRIAVIEQIKRLSETLQLKYIYEHEMGKNRNWFFNRTKKIMKGQIPPTFSPDDVTAINLSIVNIANRLLSMKITL